MAHAGQWEILNWLRQFKKFPSQVFLNHGEPYDTQAIANAIRREFDLEVIIHRQKPINLNKDVSIQCGIEMKVTYTDKNGKRVEQAFKTEDEGKKLKEKLKAQGVTDAKWEW